MRFALIAIFLVAVGLKSVWTQTLGTGFNDVCQAIRCSDDCGADGHCVELDDCSTTCVCNDGFEGNPPICTEIDCMSTHCHQNAACVLDSGGNPRCRCADGYLGNGKICSPVGDMCESQCGDNEYNSARNCACVCNDGFHDSTKTCTRTGSSDVCQAIRCSDDCGSDGHCVELDDCSTVCVCNDGFEGNPPICTEIDCGPNQCGQNAICALDSNSYRKCICADGYFGSGDICSPGGNVCGPQCGNNGHNTVRNCACVCNDGFHNLTETCRRDGSPPATTSITSKGRHSSTLHPSTDDGVSGRTLEHEPSVSSSSNGNAEGHLPIIAIVAVTVGCTVFATLGLVCVIFRCVTLVREQSSKNSQPQSSLPADNRRKPKAPSVYDPSYYESVGLDDTGGSNKPPNPPNNSPDPISDEGGANNPHPYSKTVYQL